jgi:transcriptional regulator
MYISPAFAEQRLDVLHKFMTAHPFVTLVTRAAGGLIASHVPVVLQRSRAGRGTIQLHLAKPNPQCDDLAAGVEALAVFQEPHAYISPTWYVTKAVVPTWNYVAVHAYGTPGVMDDGALHQHLNDLVGTYEKDWTTEAALSADGFAKLRHAIVGFEMPIERLEGKWKLGQNRTREDRLGAIAGLRTTGVKDDATIADFMAGTVQP